MLFRYKTKSRDLYKQKRRFAVVQTFASRIVAVR